MRALSEDREVDEIVVDGEALELQEDLPQQLLDCIEAARAGYQPSGLLAVAEITDKTNPAYRTKGAGEMCVATRDIPSGTCLGCFRGTISSLELEGAYEDSFAVELRDGKWLIPSRCVPSVHPIIDQPRLVLTLTTSCCAHGF